MGECAKILYKARFVATGVIIGMTILFGAAINIESDNSLRAWFSKDDPYYIAYEHFMDTFDEGGKYLIVALKSDHIFSLNVLRYIKQKTEALESLEFIASVYSLGNVKRITGTPETINVEPLLSNLETADINQIRNYMLEDQHLLNYLISPDERYTAIIIAFEDFFSD